MGRLERRLRSPVRAAEGVVEAAENMGAQMVREVASKTSDVAGDGTTTAIVLAQTIVREGSKMVAAGHNPMEIKRGIEATQDGKPALLEFITKKDFKYSLFS